MTNRGIRPGGEAPIPLLRYFPCFPDPSWYESYWLQGEPVRPPARRLRRVALRLFGALARRAAADAPRDDRAGAAPARPAGLREALGR
jgi:hypothetical protein